MYIYVCAYARPFKTQNTTFLVNPFVDTRQGTTQDGVNGYAS